MLQSIQTFDNKKNLLLNHSWNTTTQLYLFAPKDIANYGRRPLKYDFNESFRQQLNNRLGNVNSLGGWREEDAIMTNSLAASSAIMPTTQADLINLSGFSDYWTFLLFDRKKALHPDTMRIWNANIVKRDAARKENG